MKAGIRTWLPCLAICLALLFVLPANAQEAPNFDSFDRFASTVEITIANNRLADDGFQKLRERLVSWREEFLAAQNTNAVQIESLQAQIEALGLPPSEGASEPEAVATRRAELDGDLQEALAPRIAAEEAHARTDALIRQIDATLRSRQADALFENILRRLDGRPPLDGFDGHANCFIESGFGKGLLIDFNYDVEPLPGKFPLPGIGPFSLLEETEMNHWGKMMFKWTYWNVLLQGRPMPLSAAARSPRASCRRRMTACSTTTIT